MAQHQTEIYQYGLNIISIKMNVKFPCKMKLQINGNGLTSQVSASEGQKFIFNQELTLKQENDKPFFEISVNLITQKGGKYIAGILKIFQNQLVRSEGERIIVPLAKCLDNQAFCQLRVDQVHATRQTRKIATVYRSRVNQNLDVQYGSGQKHKATLMANQTKSEYQVNNYNIRKPKNDWEQIRSKHNAAQSYYNRNMARSPNRSPNRSPKKFKNAYEVRGDTNIDPIGSVDSGENRDKFIQAQVYKEGYQKLKQKYKKQAQNAKNELNKRITLESSENNLKLEIMRLKLKAEQQQKAINEKNTKLKEFQNQINVYQRKQLDMGYLRQQINNKDHALRMMQENIRTLQRDNQELKTINNEKTVSEQQKTKELRRELDMLRQRSQAKESELQRQLKAKAETLFIKESQLHSKNELLNRQKKNSEELQRESQNKTLQFEKILQNEKANSRNKADQLKQRIQKLDKQILNIQTEKSDLQGQIQKNKTIQVKVEYQNRVLAQQCDSLKTELAGMKAYKDKYSQIFRDHKLLLDDKNHLQKQLQRALQSKQMSASELNKQHMQQVEYFRKANKELDEKQRNLCNKVIQLQGSLEAARSGQQKVKRSLQAANAQLNELREKQKVMKKALKTKQQENLAFENQLSSAKQKNKSSQNFYRHQLQKYKQQLDKTKADLQSEAHKSSQLNQQNSQLNVQLGKIRVKLQFTQQKVQKDTHDIREKKSEMEAMAREYELQITGLNQSIQCLRNNQKQLITKMQKQEIQGLKSQERIERMTKQIKIMEQKHTFAENLLKNRQSQSTVLQTGKKDLELRSYKLQQQLSSFKSQQSQLLAQKNKNLKMIELLQQENGKLKKENQKVKSLIQEKEKLIQQLFSEIKKLKQQLAKTEMKLSTVSKDFERFRQNTAESLNTSFSALLADRKSPEGNVQSHSQSQQMQFHSNGYSKRSQVVNTSFKQQKQGPQINQMILQFSKQTKLTITKLTEQNRQLQRQNDKLQDQLAGNINKGQTSEYQYSQQLQQLQSELAAAYAMRDEQGIKFDHILKDLNARLREKDRQITDLNSQIDQLNLTNNSMRVQHDNQVQQQNKKAAMLKSRILQCEQKIEFLNMNIMNMQEKIHEQQMECQSIKGALRAERENSSRKQRVIMELQDRRDDLQQECEQGKRHRKDLLQKNSTLQLLLNTEKQQSQKLRQLLQDQEQKSMELKTFIGNLMKQKEAVIKNQLEKSEQIISLEGTILQLTRDRDIYSQDACQLAKQLDQSKQFHKKLSNTIKEIQVKLVEQKSRHQKTADKLKEKEKELINRQQTIEKLQAKITRLAERGQKQGNQLRIELQSKTQELINLTKQHSQKMFQFDKQKNHLQAVINQLRNQLMDTEAEMFNLKHGHDTRLDQINSLNGQISQLRLKIENLQLANHDLSEQIREKEESAFQFSGKVYNLQMKLQAKQAQKSQKINALDKDWICKYESICQQFEQRIEMIEKERDYYRQRVMEQDEQVKRLTSDRNMFQIEEGKTRSILQEKIRQLEDQRLHIISQKNNQIQKVTSENKGNFETLKNRQSENRKMLHQLQLARNTAQKFQLKNKQMDEKIRNLQRVYQAEIDQLKKKEALHKNFKQSISNKIWSSQREVRRVIQTFVKRVMQSIEDTRNSHRLLEVMKGFQQSVSDAMRINIQDSR